MQPDSLLHTPFPFEHLQELPHFDFAIDVDAPVNQILQQFNQNKIIPGVIVTYRKKFFGMISRRLCFEALSKPFGLEVYSKRSIRDLYIHIGVPPLILNEDTRIEEAVRLALLRSPRDIYEPIVVRGRDSHRIIDMQTLLQSQCDLLTHLYGEVQQLSLKDPLTNVWNRRGFFQATQSPVKKCISDSQCVCALMIDIDKFKRVNDFYGHFVGDQVLKFVARECQFCIRESDILGRFGGEEFIILLPATDLNEACQVAERIRNHLEKQKIFVNGYQISITVSIGVSDIMQSRGSIDLLFTQADEALYSAKWAGRNQVVIYDPGNGYRLNENAAKTAYTAFRKSDAQIEPPDEARIYDETIEGWAHALELRDKESHGHSHRVTSMTISLAHLMGIDNREMVNVRRGALLHDIGKIAIPDNILFKPGKLTQDEWEIMKKHPVYAYELLYPITYLKQAIDIPYCHHERWDGSGYPRGLNGEEIPLTARIFSLVDVWDALGTDRCYRAAWSAQEIRKYLQEQAGIQFDPAITSIFLNYLEELEQKGTQLLTEMNQQAHFLAINNPVM